MSFLINDNDVWEEYQKIWDMIKEKLGIKFIANLFMNINT